MMDISLEIRDYYQKQKESGAIHKRTISVPDAIHVATAIYYNVDEMFTFDACKTDKNTLSPSDLTNPIARKYTLKISAPGGIDGGLAV